MAKVPQKREEIGKKVMEKLGLQLSVGLSQLRSLQSISKWEGAVQSALAHLQGGDLLVAQAVSVGFRVLAHPDKFQESTVRQAET